MALTRASEASGVSQRTFRNAGVFDPIIGIDSLFFVDPLRLEQTHAQEFQGALAEIRSYYSRVIELLRLDNNRARVTAHKLVQLREIKGIGIGYGDKSDDGSAVGSELASKLISSAEELIGMGITDPAIFEVMGLFENDFGPDRLSDSIISILQNRIYAYTERMSEAFHMRREYRFEKGDTVFTLPTHPSGEKPLVLLPEEILRSLPVALSMSDISAVASFNAEVRARFNRLLAPCFEKKKASKEKIKDYVFASPERVKALMEAYNSGRPQPYDFDKDPEGIISWFEKAQQASMRT